MKLLTELNRASCLWARLKLMNREFIKFTVLHRMSYIKNVSRITRFLRITISRQKIRDRRA